MKYSMLAFLFFIPFLAFSQVKEDTKSNDAAPVFPMDNGKIMEEHESTGSEATAESAYKFTIVPVSLEKCDAKKYPQLNARAKYIIEELKYHDSLNHMLNQGYERFMVENPTSKMQKYTLEDASSICSCALINSNENGDFSQLTEFVNHPAYKKIGNFFKLIRYYKTAEFPKNLTPAEIEYLKEFPSSNAFQQIIQFNDILPSMLIKMLPAKFLPYIPG